MSVAAEIEKADMAAAEAFAENVGGILNSGAVAVMMSIGHRLGLFDLLAEMPPSTSAAIAGRAQLSERYIREWLAVMVMGGIVRYDPADNSYRFPPEHAACLTRGAPLGNLAVYAQPVALMGQIQERLLACFETGQGLAYGDFPCFHEFMEEDSGQTVVAQLFDSVLPLVDGIVERLEAGIDVLDAGCGRGLALIEMARRFPASRFLGYDLCADAIEFANRKVQEEGLANIRFEKRDLTGYHEKARFDFITSFDAVHDQKDPQALIRGLHGALRPGGVYLMQDIGGSAKLENNADFPMAAMLYAVSCAHCTPVSLGQGGLGLGTMWGWETAEGMLKEAGFSSVERNVLPHDPMNVWFVSRV
ncbi:class I SAM-dependent methyltransferase [Chelativorans sp. M5D2P16]|uniref:class I SAM-dependent methyltransferase n=1 Tax=Chelativorans sp. M5D2P16 TaxID=3095678 RepID=UPI002ACA7A62|nr:class I SAM-dependent methyltransferase [Chelativorans sp. M5D2P16]MDZ5697847.1 class I SAM-dependent methyltransferase [Chelativorans sp. M5D2P16]